MTSCVLFRSNVYLYVDFILHQEGTYLLNNIYNSNQRKDAQRDFRKLNLINSFVFSASTEKPENAKFIAKLIIIWILPFEPFGENRMVYTVKNCV